MNSRDTAARGRYGRAIGWPEHEIDWHVQNWIRAGRGLPPLPPPEAPAHPVILREAEVKRRTGLSRVHRWRLEKMEPPRFPRRVYLDDLGGEEPADAA